MLWWLYGWTYDGLRSFYPYNHLIDITVTRARPRSHETILDLGCGTGNAMLELNRRIPDLRLSGFDLSASMLRRARAKLPAGTRLQQGDVFKLIAAEPTGSYDAIVTVNVIYALTNREALWAEIARTLKTDGRLVVATSTKTGSASIIREHLEHASWVRLLNPKLIGVFLIDLLIDQFGKHGAFPFPDETALSVELQQAGLRMGAIERCYGDVDIVFVATKKA